MNGIVHNKVYMVNTILYGGIKINKLTSATAPSVTNIAVAKYVTANCNGTTSGISTKYAVAKQDVIINDTNQLLRTGASLSNAPILYADGINKQYTAIIAKPYASNNDNALIIFVYLLYFFSFL